MWILESDCEEALDGKRLWLRPGKRYLFGRTVAEPGQLAIKGPGADKVSRKHVTIHVDDLPDGDAEVMGSRSRVTVQDLGSKGGTKVNDHKYKSDNCVLSQDSNTLQMGSFLAQFRITWFPVVLSFSFTSNQLRANPLARLRQDLEPLDIKLLTEYDVQLTTHVVSKKRNTSKGLQALINGTYIVNDSFVQAIVTAATPQQQNGAAGASPLEGDFDGHWPDALQFLPPPGEEPVPKPAELFAPSPARAELFDGYTFIFYNKKQYDSLIGPITSGKGKALLQEAVAGETQIDDFIRYVKEIAGEKGLGEFEDGSEGKGVVVVKWMPNSPGDTEWFAEFFTSISLRLDHRLVDQKEFLDAILSNDASGLRRPLEVETHPRTAQEAETQPSAGQQAMDVDADEPVVQPQQPLPRRRQRGAGKSRFKGFTVEIEDDDAPSSVPEAPAANAESSQEGLFVSQDAASQEPEAVVRAGRQSQRKRPPAPEDVMDGFAPTAAQVKRRRIAAGEEPVPRQAAPPTPAATEADTQKSKAKTTKTKKEIDILEVARQHREEAERRAKAEREELETAAEDLNLAEIRRLQIEEPMELRQAPATRTREQDIADGRWDPKWNGRKNFKKFQQRGTIQGRPAEKIIVALEEVKSKDFGIGDDYWLEDGSQQRKKKNKGPQSQSQSQSQAASATVGRTTQAQQKQSQPRINNLLPVDSDESENGDMDNDEADDVVMAPPSRTRGGRASASATQSQSGRTSQSMTQNTLASSRTGKRPAASPAKEQPVKRSKVMSFAASDDDSDDELRFRFGKR